VTTRAPDTSFGTGDLATASDPYALLAEVRAAGPVLRGPNAWVVLGHAEALAVLRSTATRSGFIAEIYRQLLPDGAAREEMAHRINFLDPPDHGRVRRLVSAAFTPRRVERLRPFVAETARRILAQRATAPFDLVHDFAHQVPALVISELLGVPASDRDRLTTLSHRVSALLGIAALSEDRKADAVQAAEELHAYLRALLAERRARPGDDLLSALLAAEEDGEQLSEVELRSLAATLYSAGHRTTRDLFCNGMATLLRAPVFGDVRAGRVAPAAVVEEFLRFETPTHWVARILTEPVPVGDVVLPAGEPITIVLAAANRDERTYAKAATFDPARWLAEPPPPAPLSFAFGAHFCIGASLARLEATEMLEAVLAFTPDLRLATPGAPLAWRHSGLFRSLDSLPVRA